MTPFKVALIAAAALGLAAQAVAGGDAQFFIDHRLRQAEFRAMDDTGFFEIECRDAGDVTLQQQIHGLIVHESSVFDTVVAGAEGILDALRGAHPGKTDLPFG